MKVEIKYNARWEYDTTTMESIYITTSFYCSILTVVWLESMHLIDIESRCISTEFSLE